MFEALINWIKARLLVGSLIVSGLLLLGLAYTRHELASAKEVIRDLVEWQDGIVETTRLATGSKDMTAEKVGQSIANLGFIRVKLKETIKTQNDAIDDLVRESELARQVAAQAQAQRAQAIKRAEALRLKLVERAGTPAPDTDVAVRRTQDELYEAGL